MKNEVKEKLRIWLSQFPQSTHPLDSRRFYDVVIAMRDTDSSIDDEDIREMLQECKPDWNEKYAEEFIHEKLLLISELCAFLNYYRDREQFF